MSLLGNKDGDFERERDKKGDAAKKSGVLFWNLFR